MIEDLDLGLGGAPHQHIRRERLVEIDPVETLEVVDPGVVDQEEVGGLRIVGAAGRAPGEIQIGSAEDLLPGRAFERPVG